MRHKRLIVVCHAVIIATALAGIVQADIIRDGVIDTGVPAGVSESITNGFVTEVITNDVMDVSITNSLVTEVITNDVMDVSITNSLVTEVITNGVFDATITNGVNDSLANLYFTNNNQMVWSRNGTNVLVWSTNSLGQVTNIIDVIFSNGTERLDIIFDLGE